MYIYIVRMIVTFLTFISAHFFFSCIGMANSINSIHIILAFLLLCSLLYILRLYSKKIKRMWGYGAVFILDISLLCLASLFCYSVRIYIYENLGLLFSDLFTVFIVACSVSGSGGQIIPHSSPSPSASSEDSFGLQVLSEPWPVTHNFGYESSLRNRILALENDNSIFLLDKERGAYWAEVKKELDNCTSQKEYSRLLDFENRDLQIREMKHSSYSEFQQIISDHPALAENAAYNPQEAFQDFLVEKRHELDREGGAPFLKEKDQRELSFLNLLCRDLRIHRQNSIYINIILFR